jgi:hypothetical protein
VAWDTLQQQFMPPPSEWMATQHAQQPTALPDQAAAVATLASPLPMPAVTAGVGPVHPTAPPAPVTPGQRADGLEGWLRATVYQYPNGNVAHVAAFLVDLPLTTTSWVVPIHGPTDVLLDLARWDGTRVRVSGDVGTDGNGLPQITLGGFDQVEPNERVQAWLGKTITVTLEGRDVRVFETREGQRYVLAASLRQPGGLIELFSQDGWEIHEGTVRAETFGGLPVMETWRTSAVGDNVERFKTYQVQRPEIVVPESGQSGQGNIEQAELVYIANMAGSTSQGSAPLQPGTALTLQLAWRFTGRMEGGSGSTFVQFVDARREQ